MAGTSSKTKLITFRLPNDVYEIILRRVTPTGHPRTVSSYIRDRTIYDVRRKHGTYKRKTR